MRRTLDVVFALCACALAQGLRVTEVEVPRVVLVGESAKLRCHFALRGEALYSLKWWKNSRQFYQFIPKNTPRMAVFSAPGVNVNVGSSTLHQVELVDLETSSSGIYKCEVVGEAPTFTTHIRAANMTVIDTPDGPPVVRGLNPSGYREGDIIHLNCTSYRSWPPPTLSWVLLIPHAHSNARSPAHSPESHAYQLSHIIGSHDYQHPSHSADYQNAHSGGNHAHRHAHGALSPPHRAMDTHAHHHHGSHYHHGAPSAPARKFMVDDALLVRYPLATTWPGGQESTGSGDLPTFSATLGLVLATHRHLAPLGSFTLRCLAEVEGHVWATEVKVDLEVDPVLGPQHLPALLNTHIPPSSGCGQRGGAAVLVWVMVVVALSLTK
nr:uncharacterized protein LOC123753464 [Procambarus clarkii]